MRRPVGRLDPDGNLTYGSADSATVGGSEALSVPADSGAQLRITIASPQVGFGHQQPLRDSDLPGGQLDDLIRTINQPTGQRPQ